MLFALTGLIGCRVEARDGGVGEVKDFLFDDRNWKVRWMVVDTGDWLPGRQVLVHPSAIAPLDLALPENRRLPMISGAETPVVSVGLTKPQIEASPETREDEPVSQQMQDSLYEHYGWARYWGDTYFGPDAIDPLSKPIRAETSAPAPPAADTRTAASDGDPHLRSIVAVKGYHAARPVCGQGHRLGRPPHQCQRHSRSGEIKSSLGPGRHGGRDRPATIPPPFRLARLRLVEADAVVGTKPDPRPAAGRVQKDHAVTAATPRCRRPDRISNANAVSRAGGDCRPDQSWCTQYHCGEHPSRFGDKSDQAFDAAPGQDRDAS
jgi:hypothetical protein